MDSSGAPSNLGGRQANHFDAGWNSCAKRREHPHGANEDAGDVAGRRGKNIDHQGLGGAHLGRGPERNGGKQAAIGIDAAAQAHLIEQADDGGAGHQMLPAHFVAAQYAGAQFQQSVTTIAKCVRGWNDS